MGTEWLQTWLALIRSVPTLSHNELAWLQEDAGRHFGERS